MLRNEATLRIRPARRRKPRAARQQKLHETFARHHAPVSCKHMLFSLRTLCFNAFLTSSANGCASCGAVRFITNCAVWWMESVVTRLLGVTGLFSRPKSFVLKVHYDKIFICAAIGIRKQKNDILHAFVPTVPPCDGEASALRPTRGASPHFPVHDIVLFPGDAQNFVELMQR